MLVLVRDHPAAVVWADLLTLTDEDAIMEAKRNAEIFVPLRNALDVQRQRIRDSYPSLVSEDDWVEIQCDYRQVYDLDKLMTAMEQWHACYKQDLSILDRELYRLFAQLKSRDRLESEQVHANVDRLRVSQVIQSHAFILLTMFILPASAISF